MVGICVNYQIRTAQAAFMFAYAYGISAKPNPEAE